MASTSTNAFRAAMRTSKQAEAAASTSTKRQATLTKPVLASSSATSSSSSSPSSVLTLPSNFYDNAEEEEKEESRPETSDDLQAFLSEVKEAEVDAKREEEENHKSDADADAEDEDVEVVLEQHAYLNKLSSLLLAKERIDLGDGGSEFVAASTADRDLDAVLTAENHSSSEADSSVSNMVHLMKKKRKRPTSTEELDVEFAF